MKNNHTAAPPGKTTRLLQNKNIPLERRRTSDRPTAGSGTLQIDSSTVVSFTGSQGALQSVTTYKGSKALNASTARTITRQTALPLKATPTFYYQISGSDSLATAAGAVDGAALRLQKHSV